ncbi:hypothetical protein JCM30760_27170 [Thiomicrorhabdus hydrogeniphila]
MSKDGNISSFQSKAKGIEIKRPITRPGSKTKTIKDTFSFPEKDHQLINEIMDIFLKKGVRINKSEVVRVGLHAIMNMTHIEMEVLLDITENIERVQVGRPKAK